MTSATERKKNKSTRGLKRREKKRLVWPVGTANHFTFESVFFFYGLEVVKESWVSVKLHKILPVLTTTAEKVESWNLD